MKCQAELHSTHKGSDISKVDDGFRKQMASDVDNVTAGAEKCRQMLDRVEKEKNDFSEQMTKIGSEISEKAEQLKRMIDVHKEKLMNELSSMKQKRIKEIESLREEIERQLLSMERGADELLTFDVIERTLADLGHADVTFTSSNFVVDDVNKTLGQLRLNAVKEGEIIYFQTLL